MHQAVISSIIMFKNLLVIELASVLAGPSVGMFFAELGARVIKIENPRQGGDVTRRWKLSTESAEGDVSAYFSSINWGKESICLDLSTEPGKAILHILLAKADLLISNFIPGSDARLGIDAESLMDRHAHLICAEINGYGPTEARAAFDAIIQAEAGYTHLNGDQKGIFKMPVALMDVLAAHQLKEAILLALIQRLQTGVGGRVSVSLLEAGIAALVNQATNWLVAGKIPEASGSEHPNIAPYGTIFTTKNGLKIVLAIGTDQQFLALTRLLDLPQNLNWQHNTGRVMDRNALNQAIQGAIGNWDRDSLMLAFQKERIPAGAVNNMKEVCELPQARNLLLEGGELQGIRSFVGNGNCLPQHDLLGPPPAAGAHTISILQELGYGLPEIEKWIKTDIVAIPDISPKSGFEKQ